MGKYAFTVSILHILLVASGSQSQNNDHQLQHQVLVIPSVSQTPIHHRSLASSSEGQNVGWIQVGEDIDGGAAGDNAGRSVGISADGSRVIIGSPNNGAGHARIFEENTNGTWVQIGDDIEGEAAGDTSGRSVGISGDGKKVIIGAPLNDGYSNNAGHARVFEEKDGAWVKIGKDIDTESYLQYAGRSVGISADGTRVIVGTHATRIYERDENGDGVQVGQDIESGSVDDMSGWSVGISADGSRVIVGAIYHNGNGDASGRVRIFEEKEGAWERVGESIDGEKAYDESGWSVGISADGKRVIIGARANSDNGHYSGQARVFEEKDGDWNQVGEDIDGESADNYLGSSVGISADGTRVIIGAIQSDDGETQPGYASVFEEKDGSWVKLGEDIVGEAAGDYSGSSVGISADGERVIIGGRFNDGGGIDAGHARVYKYLPPIKKNDDPSAAQITLMNTWITTSAIACGYLSLRVHSEKIIGW